MEYQNICNPPNEETETLFGNDVADQMKTIQHIQSIGHKMSIGVFLGRDQAKPPSAGIKRGEVMQQATAAHPNKGPRTKATTEEGGQEATREGRTTKEKGEVYRPDPK